ncbi:MAG: DUF6036 family nucleotidyltransferase [Elusimicrobiota bacterium]
MNKYRVDKAWLWAVLGEWDKYVPKKVRLVACGGTALTLQDLKESTKDIDFLIPDDDEYRTLILTLRKLGYKQVGGFKWAGSDGFTFDFFSGKQIFTTELLESSLEEGNNIPIRQLKRIYVGALNDYDFIISKMFRGTAVDEEDCLRLIRARGKELSLARLKERYLENAQYTLKPKDMEYNLESLLDKLGAG